MQLILPLVLAAACLAGYACAENVTTLHLPENEVCKTKGERKWTCKLQKDCPHIRGEPAAVCSFQDKQPIVCCPPDRPPRSVPSAPTRKCAAKCDAYLELCGPGEMDALVWGSDGKRKPGGNFFSNIGGRLSEALAHPHMALIGYGNNKEWKCGGTLISENYILSAAHCAKDPELGPARWVRLGDLNYVSSNVYFNPEERAIVQAVVHPEYKPPALYNDIALFRLDKNVQFTLWVKPACVHVMPKIPFSKATACTWGGSGYANNETPQLEDVEQNLVYGPECKNLFNKIGSQKLPYGFKPSAMVCATGNYKNCTDNTGGPLAVKMSGQCLWTVVGVSSYGRQCGLPGSPPIYTRVSNYLPWIERIVWP